MAVSSASLYVGDLDARVSEHHLWEHFKPAGSLISCRVCTDSASRKSLGYGYLNFQNPADAQKALETMNGSRILDKPCRIMPVQRDPTLRKSGVGNIIIKNLPTDLDQGALFQVFQKFGKITSVKLATDETGKSRGFGYVNFETEESATSAVKEANGLTMEDKAIVVERFRSRQAIQDELMKKFTNLYIKNIDPAIDEAKLTEFFTQFGVITSAVIMKTDDGHSKGFGFVSFDDHEAAVQAVEATHGKPELAREGATLFVGRAQSKKERSLDKERKWRERQAHYAKFPNLYVKNLDDTSAEDQLAEVFGRFGPTESVRIARDPVTKVSRGFGFVSFKEHSHAQKAMTELAGSTILSSKPLYIAYAQKRDIRRQQLEEIQKKRSRMGMGQPGFGGMPGAGGPPGPLQGGMLPPNFYGGANLQAPGYGMPPFGGMSLRPPGSMLPQQPPRPPMGMVPPQQLMPPTLQRMAPQVPRPMVKPAVPAPQARAQPVIDMSYLANLSPEHQKNVLGERLYTYISKRQPEQSSKITGMLLEMDNSEILNLLDSPDLLDSKINEAVDVLRHHSGAM